MIFILCSIGKPVCDSQAQAMRRLWLSRLGTIVRPSHCSIGSCAGDFTNICTSAAKMAPTTLIHSILNPRSAVEKLMPQGRSVVWLSGLAQWSGSVGRAAVSFAQCFVQKDERVPTDDTSISKALSIG